MELDKLTLVIPAKNESESLPLVLNELQKYKVKKIIVIPKEDIETYNSIKDYDCEIIFQKKNGFGAALIEGIKNSKTKYSCIFNADGSFNPSYLREMYKLLEDDRNLSYVFNSRYIIGGGSDDDTIITKIGNYIFTALCNICFRLQASDVLFTYVMGRTDSFNNNNLNCLDFTYCVEVMIEAKKNNQKYIFLASQERSRLKGKKKVNELKDGFLILMYIIEKFLKK